MSSPPVEFSFRELLRSPLRTLPLALHWVYIVFAIPLVIFLAIRTPAFQSPDEDDHFYRSYQVAHGGFLGGSGGYVDSAIAQLDSIVADLPHHPQVRLTAADVARTRSVRWSGQLIYESFPYTAGYFPANYIPQAFAVLIGQKLRATVLNTLILARLLNGAAAIAICAFALSICRRGKVVVFVLLLMPMTLSLFASSSQDATLIALSSLAFSLISRQLDAGTPMTGTTAAAVIGCIFVLSISRPTNAVLALAFFAPGLLPSKNRNREKILAMVLGVATMATTVTWWVVGSLSTRGGSQLSKYYRDVDPKMQLLNLLHHPGISAKLLSYIGGHFDEYIASTIGNLGWLDTVMPLLYYLLMLSVLTVAVRAEMAHGLRPSKRAPIYFLAAGFAGVVGVFFVAYLMWTPVGAPEISAVQGRYFIPLFIAVAVGLPRFGDSGKDYEYATAIAVAAQLITVVVLPLVLLARYYGG